MFEWYHALGLTRLIGTMRTSLTGFNSHLPPWIVYSLPFALWVASYILLIKVIWWRSAAVVRHVWCGCIPVIAIAAEVGQGIHVVPGTFDIVDLITILFGTLVGVAAITPKRIDGVTGL
jgi:hypothetical protein